MEVFIKNINYKIDFKAFAVLRCNDFNVYKLKVKNPFRPTNLNGTTKAKHEKFDRKRRYLTLKMLSWHQVLSPWLN